MTAMGSAPGRVYKPKQERRNVARYRALKGARIIFKGREAVIDCVVRNLSDRGASKWKVPSEFRTHLILCLTTHPSAWSLRAARCLPAGSPRRPP
jgi:hypothetical protein